MNERIKELMEQATELKQNTVIDPVTYTMVPSQPYRRELNAEKFAELIVKECFVKLTPYLDDQFIDDIESELKEHFGVEE